MKLTLALLTLALLNVQGKGLAQTISLNGKNITIEQVFSSVEKQSGYVFLYTPNVLKDAKPVSIHAEHLPLLQFLELALKDQPFRFSVRSRTIHLSRKPEVEINDVSPLSLLLEKPQQVKVSGIVTTVARLPLVGATVRNQATKETVVTNNEGRFTIGAEKGTRLIVTYIGFEPYEWKVNGFDVKIELKQAEQKLDDVEVVINTGYRKFKANEMVGAADVITEKMLQQQVGTGILQRLDGLATSFQMINKSNPSKTSGNPYSKLNISIRGWNTINGPSDPLIIVDNFPYEGDINNIDPNSVASVTILKDAAAASVWGARAANGVIVIDTKKGRFNQNTRVSFLSTTSISEKPDLYKLPLLSTPEYIDLEIASMQHKLPTEDLLGTPVTDVMVARRLGKITAEDSAARIDYLKTIDSRDEWNKHIYVQPIVQQTSVSLNGGSNNIAWNLGASYMTQRSEIRETNDRIALDFGNTFKVNPRLNIELNVRYSAARSKTGAPAFNSLQSRVGVKQRPYIQLADENGNPTPMDIVYSKSRLDTLGAGLLLDYGYYPLTDWRQDYVSTNRNAYNLTARINYNPVRDLTMSLLVNAQRESNEQLNMHDRNSFYARDLINVYSIVNRANQTVTRPIPVGGILFANNANVSNNSLRGVISYVKRIRTIHLFKLDATFDVIRTIRKSQGDFSFGYSEDPLYHTVVDPHYTIPQLPGAPYLSLFQQLGMGEATKKKMLESRSLSGNTTLSYILKDRYFFYGGLRREGANILGVKTNDRWKPIWSGGVNWLIHREKFFKLTWISELKLSGSVGITGNVDPSRTSKPVGTVFSSTPFPYLSVSNPPNPNLRWEKNTTYNWGLAFGLLKNRISGNLRFYLERARDLYGDVLMDYTQSPLAKMKVNQSAINNHGWELEINTQNIVGEFNWSTRFLGSRNVTKVIKNLYQLSKSNPQFILQDGQSFDNNSLLLPGQAVYSVSAFRSAGLNSEGNIQYMVNGKPTTNIQDVYNDIILNEGKAGSFIYFGPGDPTFSGSIQNNFVWKQFQLFVSMQYAFGFYFKKPSIEFQFTLYGNYHEDWAKRWQKPGDEAFTYVPRYDFSVNDNNSQLFSYPHLSDHVRKGDHIRLNNIQLSYQVPLKPSPKGMQSLGFAFNASNLGVIWTANKEGLDPYYAKNYMMYSALLKTYSLTISAGF